MIDMHLPKNPSPVSQWFENVETYIDMLVDRPGVRDRRLLRSAAGKFAREVNELVNGSFRELSHRVIRQAMEAERSPRCHKARKRLKRSLLESTRAADRHAYKIGAAWLAACLHGTDGDRRLLLYSLGIDKPGASFSGHNWPDAAIAVGLDPDMAARAAALQVLCEIGVDIQLVNTGSAGDIQRAIWSHGLQSSSTSLN